MFWPALAFVGLMELFQDLSPLPCPAEMLMVLPGILGDRLYDIGRLLHVLPAPPEQHFLNVVGIF